MIRRLLTTVALVAVSTAGLSACVPTSKTNLLWHDEFTETSLALSTDAQASTWRTRGADDGQSLTRGTKDPASSTWDMAAAQSPSPFHTSGGVLTITARKNPGVPYTRLPYLSGYLTTDYRKQSFEYGYFEFRARIPSPTPGMYPALWLFADPYVTPPAQSKAELDVAEFSGPDFNYGMPWSCGAHDGSYNQVGSIRVDDLRSWHTYAMDWQPNYINYYRDGVLVASQGLGTALHYRGVQMSIRMNLAVDMAWGMKATASSIGFQVDYVRVYKHKP